MIVAKSIRRALLLTTVLAVSAAPAASAREADAPVHQSRVAVTTTSVPPRVDGMASQPNDRTGRVAVTIVRASSNGGFDWASAAIGAAALFSVTLLGAAGWATVRGRRVTPPDGSRAAS
jgi:hypothetical protein